MKSNIKRIVCVLLAGIITFSFFGCKKKGAKGSEPGVVDYSNLSVENGTAVVTYNITDKDGKELPKKETLILEDIDTILPTSSRYIENKKFTTVFYKYYEMSADTAKKIAQEPGNYMEFQVLEYITNNSDKYMAYKNVKTIENGKNGIWINTQLDGDFTLAPGAVGEVFFYGIADKKKVSGDALKKAFDGMSVELKYTYVDSPEDDEIDWKNVEVKSFTIH